MINMSIIAVTPSTSGQWGGNCQNGTFYQIIGSQHTPLTLWVDLTGEAILCNMVNYEFTGYSVQLTLKKAILPHFWAQDATLWTPHTKKSIGFGSNMVNHTQDFVAVKKYEILQYSLIPNVCHPIQCNNSIVCEVISINMLSYGDKLPEQHYRHQL